MAGKAKSNGKKSSSKSRPSSTSQISTALDTTKSAPQNVVCSFSPFNDWFASLTQSVDRHRLQVYTSSDSGSLVADYIIPSSRCECFEWVTLSSAGSSSSQAQSSKKRRKRQSIEGVNGEAEEQESSTSQILLALGLSSGSIHLFNPLQGKVVRVLSDSTSSTSSSSASNAISSIAYDRNETIFACLENGSVSSWNLNEISSKDTSTPSLPSQKYNQLQSSTTPYRQVSVLSSNLIVLAHHSIAVYSLLEEKVITIYTGHASNITHLTMLSNSPTRFASAAEGDRVVNIWLASVEERQTARPLATLPLDAPVRHLSASSDADGRDVLLVVTVKGIIRLYEVPSDLGNVATSNKGRKSGGIATLSLLTRARIVAKQGDKEELAAVDARLEEASKLKVARVAKGAKIIFETAAVQDNAGKFKSEVIIVKAKPTTENGDGEHLGGSNSTQRYTEAGATSAQRSAQFATTVGSNGILTGPDDINLLTDDQANLDVNIDDLEEPSLGQRLKGLRVAAGVNGVNGKDASEDEEEEGKVRLPMGSLSLGQTLTQALHSNDAALLSSCLAHSDPAVIRSSVARLSGPLAVKLLEHCVDRMGRGGKRSTGALGSARTRGIIEWVRATLIAHTGYLMSLPKLVHRLSALHSTLSSRLASHERLLALNGRLELVLGQIEMRAAYTAEQALKVQGVKTKGKQVKSIDEETKRKQVEGKQWVEESSSEEEDDDPEEMEVDDEDDEDEGDGLDDVVRGEEEGETQDIALGNDTLADTTFDSEQEEELDDAEMGSEEGVGDAEEDSEDEEELSDESALDEEGDSDDVDEEDSDINRGGLLDMEAESTDGEEESEGSEEE